MITRYPKSILRQIGNILRYNYIAITSFILLDSFAYLLIKVFNISEAVLPVVPVTILGGGLAIFLGFRNNAAYDRWWEARKIWGALVNSSRSFGTKVITFLSMQHAVDKNSEPELKEHQKRLIYRHIAFINALRLSLRNKTDWEKIRGFISEEEFRELQIAPNKATYLNHRQGLDLKLALDKGFIEDFRHMSLMDELSEFYDHQGKAERIKKTVFPFYYTYFTELFLWLFIILLPFSLVGSLNYMSVPLSVAISFVFFILDKSGKITEDPFENRASDTPLTAICKTIEIDLRHQLMESELPAPAQVKITPNKVEYIN